MPYYQAFQDDFCINKPSEILLLENFNQASGKFYRIDSQILQIHHYFLLI